MIQNIDITGVHVEVGNDLKKYITKKIGRLDRFIPKKDRASARAEVKLKEASTKKKKQYLCEVIIHLPHGKITTKETTINMFAAVDIVETKLKNQLKKYKETHSVLRGHTRRLISKFQSRQSR